MTWSLFSLYDSFISFFFVYSELKCERILFSSQQTFVGWTIIRQKSELCQSIPGTHLAFARDIDCVRSAAASAWPQGARGLGRRHLCRVSREFLRSSWLVPHWHFRPWFEKPPLGMWLTAIFFRLFGVWDLWARAGSTLASSGIVAMIHSFALRLRGALAAWISTVILLSCFGFLRVARMGELDAC